jgi:hypothetical protein
VRMRPFEGLGGARRALWLVDSMPGARLELARRIPVEGF